MNKGLEKAVKSKPWNTSAGVHWLRTRSRTGCQTPPPLGSTGSLSLSTNHDQTGGIQLHACTSIYVKYFSSAKLMQSLTVNSAMTRLGDLLGLTSLFVLFSAGKDKNTFTNRSQEQRDGYIFTNVFKHNKYRYRADCRRFRFNFLIIFSTKMVYFTHSSIHPVFTLAVSPVVCVYLGLCETGLSVQLAVVPVGFAIAATHPALSRITSLWRNN